MTLATRRNRLDLPLGDIIVEAAQRFVTPGS
jgi:hypothetical protein